MERLQEQGPEMDCPVTEVLVAGRPCSHPPSVLSTQHRCHHRRPPSAQHPELALPATVQAFESHVNVDVSLSWQKACSHFQAVLQHPLCTNKNPSCRWCRDGAMQWPSPESPQLQRQLPGPAAAPSACWAAPPGNRSPRPRTPRTRRRAPARPPESPSGPTAAEAPRSPSARS